MNETYCKIKTADLARQKGFNWKCNYIITNGDKRKIYRLGTTKTSNKETQVIVSYRNHITDFTTIPSQSNLQKWLREVHNINIYIMANPNKTFTAWIEFMDKPRKISGGFESFEKFYITRENYMYLLEDALVEALNQI